MRKSLVLLFLLLINMVKAQDTLRSLPLRQLLIPDGNGFGRAIGKPISIKNFRIDSTGYKTFYVCEIYLTGKSSAKPLLLHYLIGSKVADSLVIVFDKNFNNNFNDDTPIVLNLNQNSQDCQTTVMTDLIKIQCDSTMYGTKSLFIHLVHPYCLRSLIRKTPNRFLDSLNIAIESPFINQARFSIDGQSYQLSVYNLFPRVNYDDQRNIVVKVSGNLGYEKSIVYNMNDTLKIGEHFFSIRRLSRSADTITLQQLNQSSITGKNPGFYAYDILGKNIATDTLFSLKSLRGKIVLLEFWGTWCAPCVALHDRLKKLVTDYGNLTYLGIALDVSQKKVTDYLRGDNILNNQLFVNMHTRQPTVISLYSIESYPTFIIIDKTGKIIFRDYGINGFDHLNIFLRNFM